MTSPASSTQAHHPPAIVLAHGFTQTARSWDGVIPRLRRRLGEAVDIHAVDLPGHGHAAGVHADLWGAADHLVEAGGEAVYVGYSMGGRVALHAALAHPEQVHGLVLIGATAGIEDERERYARRAADRALADRITSIGVEAFIDEWLQLPLFDGLDDDAAMRADRHRNRPEDLAASLRTTGSGSQQPLWDRLGDIAAPTLVVAGADDEKFRELGRRLAGSIHDARLAIVDDAGHSVHLEAPEQTARTIATWYVDVLTR